MVTDGPFPEAKELLAGYRMIDVDSEARAIEIAAKASAAPGPGGVPIRQPIEVRQVMGAPDHRPVIRPTGIEDLLRELAPQVLGVLVRRFGDFDAAEDAVQEALLAAARHWPVDGRARQPAGWLIVRPPCRRMTDQFRSEAARRRARRSPRRAEPPAADGEPTVDDTLLVAVPVLPSGADAGLGDRADPAGGRWPDHGRDRQRVPGARGHDGPADQPGQAADQERPACRSGCRPSGELAERLRSVLHVLYLIFNEGYASSVGAELHRAELSGEAIRLTRMVHAALPDDAEVAGLLALMLLTDARRPARTGAAAS